MRKWAIVAVVGLMGLLLVLQYLNNKNSGQGKPPAGSTSPSGDAQGVSLPDDAAGTPQDNGVIPGAGMTSDSMLDVYGAKSYCEGGTIRDIISAYGKHWGYRADHGANVVLSRSESDKLNALMEKFVLCDALSRKDPEACGYEIAGAKGLRYGPVDYCVIAVKDVMAMSYLAGGNSQIPACEWLIKDAIEDFPNSGIKNISTTEFCSAAAKGPSGLCEALPSLKNCAKMFPSKASDCGGDKDCLENWEFYQGVKAGDPAKCGRENVEYCAGYFGKGPSCAAIAEEASKLYCSGISKAKENSLQALKERKAEEQRLKEERAQKNRIVDDINKRIREEKGKK